MGRRALPTSWRIRAAVVVTQRASPSICGLNEPFTAEGSGQNEQFAVVGHLPGGQRDDCPGAVRLGALQDEVTCRDHVHDAPRSAAAISR